MRAVAGSAAPLRSASSRQIAEVLAHPVDGEAEVEPALEHGRAAVLHLPGAGGALADDVEHREPVEAGLLREGEALGEALQEAGDADSG